MTTESGHEAAPTAELDERFSEPGATATTWSEVTSVLEGAELWNLSTVRADGRPQTSPLLAVWDGGALHFTTGDGEQKAVNLAGEPRCTLATGNGLDAGGPDLVIEGAAVRVTSTDRLERLAAGWVTKYGPDWSYLVGDGCFEHAEGGRASVFAVRPTKVLAFAKDVHSQTRFRFGPSGSSSGR